LIVILKITLENFEFFLKKFEINKQQKFLKLITKIVDKEKIFRITNK
jgi:hypothetical protein